MTGDLFAPKPTVENQPSMYGLTLWQPWAWLVSTGAKPVENRPWAPPVSLYGRHIAIHAGMKDDAKSRAFIRKAGVTIPKELTFGAIVATARVVGLMQGSPSCTTTGPMVEGHRWTGETSLAAARWYFGPFGWLLHEIVAIQPVQCRGFQKLWGLPPDVLGRVKVHHERARILARPVLPASVRGMPL